MLTASQQPAAARRLLGDQPPGPSLPAPCSASWTGTRKLPPQRCRRLVPPVLPRLCPITPSTGGSPCEVLQRHPQPVDLVAPLCQKLSNGSLLRLGIVAVAAPVGLIAVRASGCTCWWRLWRQRRTSRGVAAPVMPINAVPLSDGDLMLFFWGGIRGCWAAVAAAWHSSVSSRSCKQAGPLARRQLLSGSTWARHYRP